jgi:hypothetical protein
MCFVWIWEQTAINSLYSINWLVFITETECVYCAVRSARTLYLCVLCGSENKQRLFHYTALTGWFLKPRWNVFTARYELSLRRPFNAEARIRPCDIRGGECGTGTGFSPSTSVFPSVSFYSINAPQSSSLSRSGPGNLQKSSEEQWIEKYTHFCVIFKGVIQSYYFYWISLLASMFTMRLLFRRCSSFAFSHHPVWYLVPTFRRNALVHALVTSSRKCVCSYNDVWNNCSDHMFRIS